MSATWINRQPENRNYLSGVNFKLQLMKCPSVEFFCQAANVPGISLLTAEQPTRFNSIPIPGDEVQYEDLTVRFLVDEDLKNYAEIHSWIRELGHPYDLKELYDAQTEAEKSILYYGGYASEGSVYSQAILHILNSNFKPKYKVVFRDVFPISLGSLNFDSSLTDPGYFPVEASFKYTIYDILSTNDEPI
jgi:hypothetical protein